VHPCGKIGVSREHSHEFSRDTLSPRLFPLITADSRKLLDCRSRSSGPRGRGTPGSVWW